MVVVASLVGGVVLALAGAGIGLAFGGDKAAETAAIVGFIVGIFVGRGVYEKVTGKTA